MPRPDLLSRAREILLFDADVADIDTLLGGLNANVEAWPVQRGDDAIGQILRALALPNLAALHLLAHGAPGEIRMGGRAISAADFRQRFDGAAERELDIAFWSCNTGADQAGLAFVQAVADATGARVAAASGLVGNAALGGSWQLDEHANSPFSSAAQERFAGVLTPGPFTVADAADDHGNNAPYAIVDTGTAIFAEFASPTITGTVTAYTLSGTFTTSDKAGMIAAANPDAHFLTGAQSLHFNGSGDDILAIYGSAGGPALLKTDGVIATLNADATVNNALDMGYLEELDTHFNLGTKKLAYVDSAKALLAFNHDDKGGGTLLATTGVSAKLAGNDSLTAKADMLELGALGAHFSTNGHTLGYLATLADILAVAADNAGASVLAQAGALAKLSVDASTSVLADMQALAALGNRFSVNGNVINYTDSLDHLFALTSLTDTSDLMAQHVNVTLTTGSASLEDLYILHDRLAAGAGTVNDGAITLSEHAGDLGLIPPAIALLVAGVANHADYTWTVQAAVSGTGTLADPLAGSAALLAAYDVTHTQAGAAHVVVNAGAALATDLIAIDAQTTTVVKATAATSVTGSVTDLLGVLNSEGMLTSASVAFIATNAGAVAAADLATLKQGSHTAVDAHLVTAISGTVADILAVTGGVTLSQHEAVTVTDAASVEQLNAIDAATSGVVTASISGRYNQLASLTGTGNHYDVTITGGTAAPGDLLKIDAATTVTIDATHVTYLTGTAAELFAAVLSSGIHLSATEAISVDGGASVAQAIALRAATSGNVGLYSGLSDTAAHFFSGGGTPLAGVDVLLATNVDVAVTDATATQFSYLQAHTTGLVSGNVTDASMTLAAANFFAVETASTTAWTVTSGMVANVIDAPGAQAIHIAAGGDLNLSGASGNNDIYFDNYSGGVGLQVSRVGSTVVFTDAVSHAQVASIATEAGDGAHQTMHFGGIQMDLVNDGSAVTLSEVAITIIGSNVGASVVAIWNHILY